MLQTRYFVVLLPIMLLAASTPGSSADACREGRTKQEAFTWVAVGDHFEEPAEGIMERIAEAKPALVVGIGDLVFRSKPENFVLLQEAVLNRLVGIGARFYPVVGNHDFPVEPHWFEFWDPPTNQLYYSFDHGNSHFVVLDTNKGIFDDDVGDEAPEEGSELHAIQTQGADFHPGSEQYVWLERDLAATNKQHIFVFFHVPAFTYGGHKASPRIQASLCPLFEKHTVTAVFAGHSHGYERFVPLRVEVSSGMPVAVPDDENGVVYVVSAGGGMSLYDITQHETHAAYAKEYHIIKVEVAGAVAKCSVIRAQDGALLDAFELRSRRNGCSVPPVERQGGT